MAARIYLNVSYSEKDNAKALGAKWDSDIKKWYTIPTCMGKDKLLQLYGSNTAPVILNGEDREFGGNLLFVDLIPSTCWFTNVRSCIHPTDWDRVRHYVYDRVNYICECCGSRTRELGIQLDAHERWHYDIDTLTQKLMRIVALCKPCHQATHMGFATLKGFGEIAKQHLAQVRGFTDAECEQHITEAYDTWKERNQFEWTLDLSLITDNGIRLSETTK